MPDSNRGPIFNFVTGLFIAAVAFILLAGAFDQGRKLGEQEGRQQANSAQYAQDAQGKIESRCLPLPDAAQAECIREVVETTNEHDRSERDLVAQTGMAVWAFGMFIVSGLAAIITGLGVWFVKRTLDQTAETNRAALDAALAAHESNEIMREERRPWLRLDQDIPCEFLVDAGASRCSILWGYTVKNLGKSPAHNIRIVWDVYRYDWSFVAAGRQGVEDVFNRAKRDTLHDAAILFPDEDRHFSTQGHMTIKGEPAGTLFLCVCVSYSLDSLNTKRGFYARAFGFENEEGRAGPMAFSLKSIVGNPYTRIE